MNTLKHFKTVGEIFLVKIEKFEIIANFFTYLLLSIGLFYFSKTDKVVILDLLKPHYFILIGFYFFVTLTIIFTLEKDHKIYDFILHILEKISSTLFDIWGVILISLVYLALFKNLFLETICFILGAVGIMISISIFMSAIDANTNRQNI